ncbi:MAG: hypothetical protein DHS20C21_07180 [Gemmatimonadota bacterium]|nr:MAG: hypothetical protein DHS20C21_07180 [Gemmatimonadota bacterium]
MIEGPAPIEIQNKRIILEPFEVVWNRLVGELSKSFFVINNIEKESRLINLSFRANDPESYIDCGRTTRTYKDEVFNYQVAEDAQFKHSKQLGSNAYGDYVLNRNTEIEGRMNVYVAPDGDRATRVSVNCRYIFNVDVTGSYQAIGGALKIVQGAGSVEPEHYSMSFNTGPPTTDHWGPPGDTVPVTCGSNGTLETAVLDMAEGGA